MGSLWCGLSGCHWLSTVCSIALCVGYSRLLRLIFLLCVTRNNLMHVLSLQDDPDEAATARVPVIFDGFLRDTLCNCTNTPQTNRSDPCFGSQSMDARSSCGHISDVYALCYNNRSDGTLPPIFANAETLGQQRKESNLPC